MTRFRTALMIGASAALTDAKTEAFVADLLKPMTVEESRPQHQIE